MTTPVERLRAISPESAWPRWLPATLVAGPVVVAVASMLVVDVDRPLVLAALLTVAVAPWVAEAVAARPLPLAAEITGLAVAVQHLAGEELGIADPHGNDQLSLLLVIFKVGEVAATSSIRSTVILSVIGLTTTVGAAQVNDHYDAAPIWTAAVGIALVVGLLMRELIRSVTELKVAQDALEADATLRERQRIAREVHDVIAHSLTVTMLHVTAARMALDRGDTTHATESLVEAERSGRESLAEVRATVGLLRADPGEATAAPLPAATDLPELVDGYRAAGLDVDLRVAGDLAAVPGPLGLTLYRIAQEGLANVAKHSPGATAVVSVEVRGDHLDVEVTDRGGPPPGPAGRGHGIPGMHERVAAVGGTLDAGPVDGGWRVRASLPFAGLHGRPC